MNELVMAIRNYNKNNYKEIIDNIKKAGFKNVFIEWYNDDISLQQDILNYVNSLGLSVVFAHLGYQNSNSIWEDGIIGDNEVERYINDITICKKNNIDLVVIHPTLGYENPGVNELGIKRIKKIVEHAKKVGVKVAFENVELKGYLEYILENITADNLGICYDAGHCNLFYGGEFNTEFFKGKVFAIHLHDNYGQFDEHNLPFDGVVNWDNALKQIIDMNYNSYVIIESGYNKLYSDISLEQYYDKAYQVGLRIIEMLKHK